MQRPTQRHKQKLLRSRTFEITWRSCDHGGLGRGLALSGVYKPIVPSDLSYVGI
jgi:hypothetical protein